MKIEKKEAIKQLWAAIEDTTKALKALSDNPVVSSSISKLWDSLSSYQDNIRALTQLNITLGNFYKFTLYDKSYAIFKAEHLDTNTANNSDSLGLKVKMLTSSSNKFNYNTTKEDMIYSITELNNNDKLVEIEINPQDLPLYIGNEFLGSLFKELMTEAGLPIPVTPEPEPEE
jgi:hypothetical protein